MADRYWVGGTGTWDTTTTNRWSAASAVSFTGSCSGTTLTTTGSPALAVGMTVRQSNNNTLGTIVSGANPTWTMSIGGTAASQTMKAATSGASVPTATDNVIFDANSSGTTAYNVTMTGALNCLNLTVSALTPSFVTGTSPTIAIAGSMSLASGMVWGANGPLTFTSTSTGQTVTTNGTTISGSITFSGVGGGWTLGSALTTSLQLTITAGALNTSAAGNYTVTCANFQATSASTSSLTLNASTLNISASNANFSGTGFTLSAGTSQINLSSTSPLLTGPQTFRNVSFIGASGNFTINGANTFNNLTFTGPSTTGIRVAIFGASQTINGALTGSGATVIRRIFYRSATIGGTVTLTMANPATISNADFRDIVATSTITATSGGGNCGGNSGITFPAAKTRYWNLAGAQNWSATGWATTPTGSPALANFPLAQDTAVFTNSGSAGTVTMDTFWAIGTLDMSGRTSAMTLTDNVTTPVYGSWLNGTGVTLTGTLSILFAGRGNTQQISGNGVSFPQPLALSNIGGTIQLTSGLTTAGALTLTNGTLDLQSYTLTALRFASSSGDARTLALGTGNMVLTNTGNAWTTATSANFTTTSATGAEVVSLTAATAKTFTGGGAIFNYTLNQGGAGALTINGSNTFSNITNTVQPATVLFEVGSTNTFSAFSLSGTAGNLVTIGSVTAGSTYTLSKASGTVDVSYCTISDSIATGGATWNSPTSNGNVDGGNNTGWNFAASGNVSVNATGVAATGAVGTSVIQAKANAPTTGPPATGYVGDVFVALPASVTLTGVEAAGSVGTVTVVAKANVTLTGVEATGSVGTAMVATLVFVTGVEATGSVGTVVVAAKANADVTGVEATGSVGTATVTAPVNITLTGVEATGSVGDVTVYAAANDNPDGVEATGSVGTVEVAAQASITLTGVSASGAVGTVTTQSAYRVTGVSATGAVGTVSVGIAQRFSVTGVSATGYVSSVNVWSVINDNQTPDWVPVDDTQSGSWTQIVDGNTVVWTDIPT